METSPSREESKSNPTTTTTATPNGLLFTPPHTPTPKPISKSPETNNPYPTTYVQADTTNFKQVVQMLTGTTTSQPPSKTDPTTRGAFCTIPPVRTTTQKKQGFKLYQRRNSLKNGLVINTLAPGPALKPEILSPSILDFPALVLSPVTPLNGDNVSKSPSPSTEEEKAIAEKKFYLLPSPRTTAASRNTDPQLLPLFPVTSPRILE